MEKTVLNYRIIIEKEYIEGKKGKFAYHASCPVLGLSDSGKTIDQAMQAMEALIKFHIESLQKLGYTIPVEKEATTIVTSIEIPIISSAKLSSL